MKFRPYEQIIIRCSKCGWELNTTGVEGWSKPVSDHFKEHEQAGFEEWGPAAGHQTLTEYD